MKKAINPNSILFLYEGDTEGEFYKKLIDKYLSPREIRKNYGNLNGIFSLNDKVKSRIESYLLNESFKDCKKIHVIVAYDRDGTIEKTPHLDTKSLEREFIYKNSRIATINEIIATQDLESWFFHDLEGIYSYLRVPKAKRVLSAYQNVAYTNNRTLSSLFHRFNKHYQKGKKASGFIDSLDLDKIYNNCDELKKAIAFIKSLSQ